MRLTRFAYLLLSVLPIMVSGVLEMSRSRRKIALSLRNFVEVDRAKLDGSSPLVLLVSSTSGESSY